MALYLKYRPQSLDELIGQEAVKKTLLAAHQSNKLSHAYLMVGPRGTGKTSTARILAKMVNCLASESPCNKCISCKSITDGSNLDLIEIDAASNRGIDDIRTLRETIKLSPSSSSKKVYIIDEVHMLTTEAFNALLKTLEEPPEHALFILATTDMQKIPATILSRVQRLDFKLATSDELLQAIKKVVKSEKIDIEEEALKEIVKRADGSFRDAIKLIDQISSTEGKITTEHIKGVLHGSSANELFELLENLSNKDSKSSILFISKQVELGADFKVLLNSLIEVMRALFLVKNNLGQLVEAEYDSAQYQKLKELAEKFSGNDLSKGLDSLLKALEKMKFSSIPQLPLELAVVEICGTVSQRVSKAEEQSKAEVAETLKTDTLATGIQISSDTPTPDMLIIQEKWTFVLETVKPYNYSLEALLRSAKILECEGSRVTLEVPYSFHQRILDAPKNRDLLEGVLSEVLGKSVKVSITLGQRPARVEDIANIEVAADDEIIQAAAEIFSSETIN